MVFVLTIAALVAALFSLRACRMRMLGYLRLVADRKLLQGKLREKADSFVFRELGTEKERTVELALRLCQNQATGPRMDSFDSTFQKARYLAQLSLDDAAELLEISRSALDLFDSGMVSASARQISVLNGYRASLLSDGHTANEFPSLGQPDLVGQTGERARKAALGQFFTPEAIARFMAGMFAAPSGDVLVLDAGAGEGALTTAFFEKWGKSLSAYSAMARAFECDEKILPSLKARLAAMRSVNCGVIAGDFLEYAANSVSSGSCAEFTHAILNPPYRKIGTESSHRKLARKCGFETVNLYSAFVGAALAMLRQGGELVAIIPRSFCNGPYYLDFRRFILSKAAIEHIHVFSSRVDAFATDEVLQENVILKLVRCSPQGQVTISSSTDQNLFDYKESRFAFSDIVEVGDKQRVIHVPTNDHGASRKHDSIGTSLEDLGISCSTGPVVDFRMKESLRANFVDGSVPLLYPIHFSGGRICWPKENSKKPNAIELCAMTKSSIWPAGHYTVVRRLSSKEERRRVHAATIEPTKLPNGLLAFENHLNVFHHKKRPIDRKLAWGLAAYLNSTIVDQSMRSFSGHTQVNASDLRRLRYPSLSVLEEIGEWYSSCSLELGQVLLDAKLAAILQ